MASRSYTRGAAQAAMSKDDDSSKKKITFNIGSSKVSSKKKEVSANSQELAIPLSSDTDYPNSGSSAGVSKASSHQVKSSQDDMFVNEVDDLHSSNSHSTPLSGSSLEYSLIKNFLHESNVSDKVILDSHEEAKVPRVRRTSTPHSDTVVPHSGTVLALQNLSEVSACHEGNAEEINSLPGDNSETDNSLIENSQAEITQIPLKYNEIVVSCTKRKRQDSNKSDSQLPDTLLSPNLNSDGVLSKKCRQSVEFIGHKTPNNFSKLTQVVDLADDLEDDEDGILFLPDSLSQRSQNMNPSQNFKKSSQQITPTVIEIDDKADTSNDCSMPSIVSNQQTNGNALSHKAKINDIDTMPLDFNKSVSKLKSRSNLHKNEEQEVYELPNSHSIYAGVKDNFSMTGRSVTSALRNVRSANTPKGNTSTPTDVINLDSDVSHNTPEITNGTSAKHEDTTVTFHNVLVMVKYSRSVNDVTKNCTRELVDYWIQEGGKRKLVPTVDDVSPGALTDVSGRSKDNSPAASVTSLGMYSLQPTTRQSIVSTTSSSSASSAASLQEKNKLKLHVGSNSVRIEINTSKSNCVNKSASKDLKFEMCLVEKHLTRVENDSLFASPNVSNIPIKTKSNARRSLGRPSPASIIEVSPEEESAPSSKDESLPSTKPSVTQSTSLSNGSMFGPDSPATESVQPPVRTPKPKSTKKSASKKKLKATPTKKQVPEIVVDTPKSSTKKQARKPRSKTRRKARMSPIVETIPKAEESTPKEKTGKVPPARKGLMLTPKLTPKSTPKSTPANSRRMVSDESTTGEDLLYPPITPDQPMLAFARWTDRRYYSCTVTGSMKDGRYNIKFDDGASKCVAEEFVIPVNQLWKGLSIFAKTGDKDYEPGSIVKLEVKDGIVMYVVELDSFKTVSIPRSALFMTEDQARVLQEETWGYSSPSCGPKRAADVSLDNMVGGKRRRFAAILQRLPKASGENKPPPTPTTMTPFSDTSDDVNFSNEEICGLDVEFYPIPYPSLKDGGLSKTACKVKGQGKAVATEKTTDMQLNELLGPIPEEGSKLFAGMQFLFTSVGTTSYINALGRLDESATTGSGSDGPDMFCKVPLFKERLVAQITAGGGIVHDRFEQLPAHNYGDCYLIASGVCQTAKYLLCLAHKIAIVNHDWIISSIKAGKRIKAKQFYLPAGKSIMDHGAIIEQRDRPARDQALKNMDVLIVSEADNFVGFWSKVLEAMGARVSSLTPDSDEWPKETDVDVILSDNSIGGSKMKSWADNFGVRVVNPEWVKYCVIKGVKGDINFERFSILEY